MNKRLLYLFYLVAMLSVSSQAAAQTAEEFNALRSGMRNAQLNEDLSSYKEYRDNLNSKYADKLSKQWSEFYASPAIPQPTIPEPPEPQIADPDDKPLCEEIPILEMIPPRPKVDVVPPKPVISVPKTDPLLSADNSYMFDYYGTKCRVELKESQKFTLSSVSEKGVSELWSLLSTEEYDKLVTSSLWWRDDISLSDWGYVRFVEKLSNSYFGSSKSNEAVVMQLYLLVQSGYKARIAKSSNVLYLLLPFQSDIYEYTYIDISGSKYYIMSNTCGVGQSFSVFTDEFIGEQTLSLLINSEPKLDVRSSKKRVVASKRYPNVSAEVSINENLMSFYNDFPRSSNWDFYSHASLSDEAKSILYPMLRESIASKSELEGVEILLNFTQTAFDYKTDDEQFGMERPLFADETLFYPYSDCEDRSILFSVLVRELMGLDAVLIHYPGHLATAVCFTSDVEGDYFNVKGRRFTICDPTYIGARVGLSMPDFREVKASIITL